MSDHQRHHLRQLLQFPLRQPLNKYPHPLKAALPLWKSCPLTSLSPFSHLHSNKVLSLIKALLRQYSSPGFHLAELKTKFFALTCYMIVRMIASKRHYGEANESLLEGGEFRDIVSETFQHGGASNLADFVPVMRWLGIGRHEMRLRRDAFFQRLIDEHHKEEGVRIPSRCELAAGE